MQATGNGLKSVLRTPGKTLLFILILTVTAALLMVSCCVYSVVRGYLTDCNSFFHTIAELEYIGQNYPDQTVYDESFANAVEHNRDTISQLIASDSVLGWEPASSELMLCSEVRRWDEAVPMPDAAVLRVKLYTYEKEYELYTGVVSETLYSRSDFTNRIVMIRGKDGEPPLEYPADYLFTGRFYYSGYSGFYTFQLEDASFLDQDDITELPALLPGGASEADEAPYRRYAETLHLKNDACRVSYTADMEDLYPFHQQLLTLTDGRFFTQEEYSAKAKVCVVSERLAGMLGRTVGDTIPFTLFHVDGDLYEPRNRRQIDEDAYQIVGIVSENESYPFWVFLPDADAGKELHPVNGYTLGQFRLENSQVSAFLEAAAPLLEHGFRLNVYDQGYAAATEPMEELQFISGIFLAVCLLLAACALAMQSHLFVSRQREAARTMYAMGSGRIHVCVYFLSAAMTLTLCGAVFGAVLSKAAENWVFGVLQRFAVQFAEQDLRFSATRLAITRTLEFDPVSPPGAYFSAVGILAGGTLLFTLVFALLGLRERKTKQKKAVKQIAPKRAARVSRLSCKLKYGLLSLLRGRSRTTAVLLLGLAVTLFFSHLTSSLNSYREQLNAYKSNAVITGNATDYYGKRISGLRLNSSAVGALATSDLVESFCVTSNLGHVKILGAEGKAQIPFDLPSAGSYAYESVLFFLSKEPAWAGTSSISDSPLFHFSEGGSVEWLDGWSEADFTRTDVAKSSFAPVACAMPQAMMEQYGIALGDVVNIAVSYYNSGKGTDKIKTMQLLVVASYLAPVDSNTIFSPITFTHQNVFSFVSRYHDDQQYWIEDTPYSGKYLNTLLDRGLSLWLDYSSFTFTLKDSKRLDELRAAMDEAGFTWVHSGERVKPFAMIEDDVYLNTVHSMERQIQYVSVLYAALYLLAGVIGFALAWLLILSRRKEIAVMRALGTQPGRIVGSFLLELLLLMAAGLVLGLLLCRVTGIRANQTQLLLTAAFLSVWTLSALLCLNTGLRKQSFAALTEPE
jgi:ABC-type lipoprotein release transport system permease subunit